MVGIKFVLDSNERKSNNKLTIPVIIDTYKSMMK